MEDDRGAVFKEKVADSLQNRHFYTQEARLTRVKMNKAILAFEYLQQIIQGFLSFSINHNDVTDSPHFS